MWYALVSSNSQKLELLCYATCSFFFFNSTKDLISCFTYDKCYYLHPELTLQIPSWLLN